MHADTPVQYQRLPGAGLARRGGSIIAAARTTCRLWLGDDHLLQVESMGGYSESYKRFYFRDIQAIVVHKTSTWLAANIAFGLLTGFFLIFLVAIMPKNFRWSDGQIAGGILLGILVSLFGVCLLANLIKGPTCRSFLKTAVHSEELPSLRRRRNAEKVLARIRPLIESAQGSATPESITPQYEALLAKANAVPAVPSQVLRFADPTVTSYASRVHQVLFLALLADMGADVLSIFLPSIPVVLLSMAIGAVVAASVLVALVKQHQTDLNLAVRVVTWITAVFVGIDYLIGYVIMVVMAPTGREAGTQWGYIKAIADLRPLETRWWLGILTVTAAVAALLGSLGLVLLRQHWREKESAA